MDALATRPMVPVELRSFRAGLDRPAAVQLPSGRSGRAIASRDKPGIAELPLRI